MTCGINLGFLLFLFVLNFSCSWETHQGEDSWSQNLNMPVFRLDQYRKSTPQDGFRHMYMAKHGSANSKPQQHPSHSQSRSDPSVHSPSGSPTKPRWHKPDSNASPKPSGSSASGSSDQLGGFPWTLRGRTGPYAPSKPDFHSSKSNSQQISPWKPHFSAEASQQPGLNGENGFNLPKEHIRSTSGLSWGKRVDPNSAFKPYISLNPPSPVGSGFSHRIERPSSQKPGFRPHFVPFKADSEQPFVVHYIPSVFGGVPIKRLGDEDEEETKQTTTKRPRNPTTTQKPPRTNSSPTRPTPKRPSVHQKSKWMRVKSSQLNDFLRAQVEVL